MTNPNIEDQQQSTAVMADSFEVGWLLVQEYYTPPPASPIIHHPIVEPIAAPTVAPPVVERSPSPPPKQRSPSPSQQKKKEIDTTSSPSLVEKKIEDKNVWAFVSTETLQQRNLAIFLKNARYSIQNEFKDTDSVQSSQQGSDYSNDNYPEKPLQEIVDLPTWETLQQRNLAEALENARHSIEDDILILEYLSKWKIYHIPTASYRQATVRVYEVQLFTKMKQARLESEGPFCYDYRVMLYDEELIIGYGDISYETLFSNNLVIQNLVNLRPAEYSKVGSAVLKELIISIVEESKQFDGAQNEPIAHFWKTTVKNLPITLTSVFEALLFYDKHFFLLSKPEALILSHPHVPQFLPGTLEGIEKFNESTHIRDYYDDQLKHYKDLLLKYGIPISAVGITERFRKGTPTELDWQHLMLWDFCLQYDYTYINDRLDYTDFKNEFPDLTDYLDETRWLEPAKVVLEKERARFQLTKGKYKGMHQDIPMYLDRESFLDKFYI